MMQRWQTEHWVNQFENVNYRTIFIIVGVGNGIYIRKLAEKYPENYIIVCEPDMELFVAYLETQNMKKGLFRENISGEREKMQMLCILN